MEAVAVGGIATSGAIGNVVYEGCCKLWKIVLVSDCGFGRFIIRFPSVQIAAVVCSCMFVYVD